MNSCGVVVSARTASQRLPGKALLNLGGLPMIQFLLERLRPFNGYPLIFATTLRADDDLLAETVGALGVPVFRGSDADVVARHLALADQYGLEWIVRITGDCPFVDADFLQHCLGQWDGSVPLDLVTTKGAFPVGLDLEIFSVAALRAREPTLTAAEREHLTLVFYDNKETYRIQKLRPPSSWPKSDQHFTVDTQADYLKAQKWVNQIGRSDFSIPQLLSISN